MGLERRAPCFARHLNHTPSPFCSGYFRDRVLLFAQASLNPDSHFMFPTVAGMTGMYYHAQLLAEIGSCLLFARADLEPQ
jgi:hypothetical protein